MDSCASPAAAAPDLVTGFSKSSRLLEPSSLLAGTVGGIGVTNEYIRDTKITFKIVSCQVRLRALKGALVVKVAMDTSLSVCFWWR